MVAIDMEIPSCCARCPFDIFDKCLLTKNIICGDRLLKGTEGRLSDCPLVEIVTCKDCRFKHKTSDFHETEYRCRKYLQAEINGDFYCCGGRRE